MTSLRHLLARAVAVEQRVRRAVEARQRTDPDPDDAFKGLYLTEENVARLLDEEGARSFPPPDEQLISDVPGSRLTSLAREFGLTPSTSRSCSSRSYRIWTTGSRRSTAT